IYENYQRKSGESVSLLFLYIWILGDVFGLIGGIGQDLIVTALILYVYYFVADAVLLAQIHYYNHINRRAANSSLEAGCEREPLFIASGQSEVTSRGLHGDRRDFGHYCSCSGNLAQPNLKQQNSMVCVCGTAGDVAAATAEPRQSGSSTRLATSLLLPLAAVALLGGTIASLYAPEGGKSRAMTLLRVHPLSRLAQTPTEPQVVPQILGYISALLFLGARIPQLAKNYRKQSCEGLSIGMFIFSILGNMSFTLSLLLHSLDSNYLLANVPWIIGSTGTMFFDLAIFYQFYIYNASDLQSTSEAEDDESVTQLSI
ncbi:hypothetical protein EV174_003392, partial [Coemansia sp. RSA 2320]